jgi:putative nucleotidyltransferase with HDIG domain
MNTRAKWYTATVALGAVACSAALYLYDPSVPANTIVPIVLLCVLGLVAETLTVVLPNSVIGSIGFIPFLSLVLVVPNWASLVAATVVRLVVEWISKRRGAKAFFNICQYTVTFAVAVLVFRLTGGESMLIHSGNSLARMTLIDGFPVLAAFVASFAVNHTIVNGIVAANSNRPFAEVWRITHISTIALDIVASPIVFMFAYVYVRFGPYAATALWLPVLGLRQLHKNNLELERTNSELLELLVKSMEARDPYTSGHSRRVQQYSMAIARALNLGSVEIEKVGRASLLHDVGKIYEKYAPILRKPGKLSPDEWHTMQEHPADGAELVSTMSRLHDIVPPIRHHHERWDGTGYPHGLAGEQIPLISRIIAFADTIDAMTSERPYRRTLAEEEVRAEIVRCRGTQFDPSMADKILSASVWRSFFVPSPVGAPAAKAGLNLLGVEQRVAKPTASRVESA